MTSLDEVSLSSDDGSSFEAEGYVKNERVYDNVRSFIDEQELNSEMSTATLLGLNRYIANNFKTWKYQKLIAGITGNSGVGKSSLINALRELKSKDKGAAPVGLTETTEVAQTYTYPQNDNIVLMDFPGLGTVNFPKDQYMTKTKLLDSDVVIIVSATRFTDNDIWIAKEVINYRKNIDSDLYNAKQDDPENFNEYTCIVTIKKEIETNLDKGDLRNLREEIFIVSSRDSTKYNFASLVEKLKCLLNMKTTAILYLLNEYVKKAIDLKTKKNEDEFIGRKVLSVITGFLPIPKLESTIDTYHVSKIWKTCLMKYCIDAETLKQFATEVNKSVEDLQRKLKSYDKEISDGEQLHSETEDEKGLFMKKYSKYAIPILGSLYSAYKSPHTMQECLNKICHVMAEEEKMLVKLRLWKLKQDLETVVLVCLRRHTVSVSYRKDRVRMRTFI